MQVGISKDVEQFHVWWQRQGEWVEAPNQRRGGESGVQRLLEQGRLYYLKRQTGHLYRSLKHPLGQPTVLREARALRAWAKLGVPVPQIIYAGAVRVAGVWQALLVTAALEGYVDLDHWYACGARERFGEPLHNRLLQQLGQLLARLHAARWQHGCLYGKHVFVRAAEDGESVDVALIDLEKSRRRWIKNRAMRHDFSQLRRHSSLTDMDWQQLLYGYGSLPSIRQVSGS